MESKWESDCAQSLEGPQRMKLLTLQRIVLGIEDSMHNSVLLQLTEDVQHNVFEAGHGIEHILVGCYEAQRSLWHIKARTMA